MKRLLEFFEEENGGLSSMRLIFISWGAGTLVVWAKVSWMTNTIVDMPFGILGLFAAFITGKVTQRKIEGEENSALANDETNKKLPF